MLHLDLPDFKEIKAIAFDIAFTVNSACTKLCCRTDDTLQVVKAQQRKHMPDPSFLH